MPYVTQRRITPGSSLFDFDILRRNEYYNTPWSVSSNYSREAAPYQDTMSWRTGGHLVDSEDPEIPKNGRDMFRAVLKEERETSSPFDNGHAFYTTKCTYWTDSPRDEIIRTRPAGTGSDWAFRSRSYLPGLDESNDQSYYPSAPKLTSSEIVEYGTRLIGTATPTKSAASLSTLLGELLLNAFPMLPGVHALDSIHGAKVARHSDDDKKLDFNPSTIGGEYLNIQFGWKPLIGDVKKILRAVKESNRLISQYMKDSGKVVRRRIDLPAKTEVSLEENAVPAYRLYREQYGNYVFPALGGLEKASREYMLSQQYSFVGAFSYYLPEDKSLLGKLERFDREADLVLGSRIDIETIWNLLPWSWFVDWFGTIGDTIANIDRFSSDGLVLRYGYLMRHTVAQYTYRQPPTLTFNPLNGDNGTLSARQHKFRRETKERVKASPYGFVLKDADLSATQWTILGALGMTKGPTSLRGSS